MSVEREGNQMEQIKIEELYDLNETIAKDIFTGKTYPGKFFQK